MNVLAISDKSISFIHSPQVCSRFPEVELVISCGDLDYLYLEYVVSMLNVPLFYVRGNHDKVIKKRKTNRGQIPAEVWIYITSASSTMNFCWPGWRVACATGRVLSNTPRTRCGSTYWDWCRA